MLTGGGGCGCKSSKSAAVIKLRNKQLHNQPELSLLDLIFSSVKKSIVPTCIVVEEEEQRRREDQELISAVHEMEIGWPTDVQHITHVTFDRFHGFLGLPLEFEVEIPCNAPSASANVCGVSANSMQWSYDARGNIVPTILLLMQEKLYSQGGLYAEGIFRINPENSEAEHIRDQLNHGVIPEDIDIHCLAGLIKSWFRELPCGVLDGISPEQVLQCDTEEEYVEIIKQLKPTESSLLKWAIDLMADVVELERFNKMNSRNIAVVFAPNMTKMLDPLMALKHAVQVMNLLKTLIDRRLREREEAIIEYLPTSLFSSREANDDEEDYVHDRKERGISCESTGLVSDDDDDDGNVLAHYSPCNEEEEEDDDDDEIESLNDAKYSFLRQIEVNENKDGFRKQLERILCVDYVSP